MFLQLKFYELEQKIIKQCLKIQFYETWVISETHKKIFMEVQIFFEVFQ